MVGIRKDFAALLCVAIADYYQKNLESNGWKIENTMASDQMIGFTAVKDNRQTLLQVLNADGKRTINQVVADKP